MPDLPAQSPREDRNHGADEQHGRDRKEKLETGPVDDDVAWQAKQRQAFDPGPGQAQQNEARTQSDEQAVHRWRVYGITRPAGRRTASSGSTRRAATRRPFRARRTPSRSGTAPTPAGREPSGYRPRNTRASVSARRSSAGVHTAPR